MEKQLSQFREDLLTRIIHIYGFEHEFTIAFAKLLEEEDETEWNNTLLENLVICNEKYPIGTEWWHKNPIASRDFEARKPQINT